MSEDSSNETPNSQCAKNMREGESVPLENMMDATDCGISIVPELDRNNLACLVKIYDTPESDLKLNDVFAFIGVLAFDTDVKDDKCGENKLVNCFDKEESVNLPSRKVPRLYCLVHRKLSVNDLISSSPIMEVVVLGDDELAAHFMLLHLLSKVHLRVDTVPVGKLSLNLSGSDKSMKDYETNILVPGALQCAEGSHLIVDEAPLQFRTLNNNGVENARLLKDLLDFQKVEYGFKYYKMKMDADVQLLILLEGKSNILPVDVVLPFHPTTMGPLGNIDAETLDAWRWW
nr:hypothetical protein [Tanacetum cinerariifolium]